MHAWSHLYRAEYLCARRNISEPFLGNSSDLELAKVQLLVDVVELLCTFHLPSSIITLRYQLEWIDRHPREV